MKSFIVGSSMFIILLFFPLQQGIETINHYKMQSVNTIVHVHSQKARIDGYFTEDNIQEMRDLLKTALYLDDAEIVINVTTTPKYRKTVFDETEFIHYEVSIPIEKVIAMSDFFGVSDNQFNYIVKGTVPSERLQ